MPDHTFAPGLPGWVPAAAGRYLIHVETGRSIRALARDEAVHPSTMSRQIRRLEKRRDDPLVDEALTTLGRALDRARIAMRPRKETSPMPKDMTETYRPLPDDTDLRREAKRVLRRLCESDAFLVVSEALDQAVVLRDVGLGEPSRTARMPRDMAAAFALQDWIRLKSKGKISTYEITQIGRSALRRLLAEDAPPAGCAEAQSPFAAQHRDWGEKMIAAEAGLPPRKHRYNLAESPLSALARRKDTDGRPFLSPEMIAAGERLREDFELSQIGPRVGQNWDKFLTGGDRGGFAGDGKGDGNSAARSRVMAAMEELGPGLGDILLRVCCFLEGLEAAEKRMGWSARSGKIVLRIALTQLARYYDGQGGARTIG